MITYVKKLADGYSCHLDSVSLNLNMGIANGQQHPYVLHGFILSHRDTSLAS